jgi:hypothetical protein
MVSITLAGQGDLSKDLKEMRTFCGSTGVKVLTWRVQGLHKQEQEAVVVGVQ